MPEPSDAIAAAVLDGLIRSTAAAPGREAVNAHVRGGLLGVVRFAVMFKEPAATPEDVAAGLRARVDELVAIAFRHGESVQ